MADEGRQRKSRNDNIKVWTECSFSTLVLAAWTLWMFTNERRNQVLKGVKTYIELTVELSVKKIIHFSIWRGRLSIRPSLKRAINLEDLCLSCAGKDSSAVENGKEYAYLCTM